MFKYIFNGSDVDKFEFCPLCGSRIIEVYPGDRHGHTTCFNEDCDDVYFEIKREDAE